LKQFIEKSDKFESYKYALSTNRVCICLPYDIFQDKRRPPDNEENLIFACPGYDGYVSEIIDQMEQNSDKNLVKWKLIRLGKVFDMGWKSFEEQYLKNLN